MMRRRRRRGKFTLSSQGPENKEEADLVKKEGSG